MIGAEDDLRQGAIGIQKLPYSRWLGGYLKRALIAPSPWIILRPIQIFVGCAFAAHSSIEAYDLISCIRNEIELANLPGRLLVLRDGR